MNTRPNKPTNESNNNDESEKQAEIGTGGILMFLIAVVIGIAACATGSFHMFDTPYAFEECGGPAMLIELIVLFVIAAVFRASDSQNAKRLAKLEKMLEQLLVEQQSKAGPKSKISVEGTTETR